MTVHLDSRSFSQADSDAVYHFAESGTPLADKVKDAISIIDKAVHDYGLDHVALSFNGGKDCTVLIHLLAASVLRHLSYSSQSEPTPSSSTSPSPPSISSIYIRCESPFPQVEAFVTICQSRYHLELDTVEGGMKEALEVYIDRKGKQAKAQEVKAILVGTRRGDPHGELLKPFDPTDPGWPQFMRVHPILDWTYKEIWDFLREESLTLGGGKQEWCELYDYGYTSLGSTHNTFPNPLLKATDDPSVLGGWRPAWCLEDATQERAGREIVMEDFDMM